MTDRAQRAGGRPDPGAARPSGPVAPSAPTSRAEQLRWATDVLERSGSPDPAGEAAALLAAVLGVAGGPPASRAEALLAATDVDRFLAAVARRSRESRARP